MRIQFFEVSFVLLTVFMLVCCLWVGHWCLWFSRHSLLYTKTVSHNADKNGIHISVISIQLPLANAHQIRITFIHLLHRGLLSIRGGIEFSIPLLWVVGSDLLTLIQIHVRVICVLHAIIFIKYTWVFLGFNRLMICLITQLVVTCQI